MSWSKAIPADAARSFDEHVHACLLVLERDIGLLLQPIAQELQPLHDEGKMHGGIHPAALRYTLEGELDREYFNAQTRVANSRPDPRIAHGYLAPETLEGAGEDPRSDCYALGALLFQTIVGHPPAPAARRDGKSDALRAAEYPQWPVALLEAVNRCLALDQGERIANVRELWQAVSAAAGQPADLSSETTASAQSPDAASADAIHDKTASETPREIIEVPAPNDALSAASVAATPSSTEVQTTENVTPPSSGVAAATEPLPSATPPPRIEQAARVTGDFPSKIQIRDRLANASVGKPYRQSIREVFGDQADRVAGIALSVPEASGLVFEESEGILHGTPRESGELKLALAFHHADRLVGRSPLTHVLALTINPDPKSLWKNLKSDPAGLFAKPDEDKACFVTPHLTALAASLRGRSHAHEGKYREDDFAMRFVAATGWHIFITADGAGSAKFSRRGSQAACQRAITELETKLGAENELDDALEKLGISAEADDLEKLRRIAFNTLAAAAHQALVAIGMQATEQQAALRDFNTTFIVVLAKQLESKWFLASFSIGDGGAGVLVDAEHVELLTRPDSGEFAGQTVFLTSPRVFNDAETLLGRTHAAFCDQFRFLAVMTDGITDPIFQSDVKLESAAAWEAWRQRLSEALNLDSPEPGMEQALLDYLHFPSPGNHDDRTLILAVPKTFRPQP